MSDAKTAAIEAAKAAAHANAKPLALIGADGKLTNAGLALAVCGGLGALMLMFTAEDVFYVDGRGVTRHVRHGRMRNFAITGDDDDDRRWAMDLTGEIGKIVADRIYAEVEKKMDAEWRERKMATRKPIPKSEQKHMDGLNSDTLCGETNDNRNVVAKPHEPITCEACLRIIRACRDVAPWRVV